MQTHEERSLLVLSLTINACSLTFFLTSRVVTCICKGWRERRTIIRVLSELHGQQPWLMAKIFTEQLLSLTLIVMAVIVLVSTPVSDVPFSGAMNLPNHAQSLIQVVMAMNIGRYIYMSVQDTFLYNRLQNFRVDIVHHLVTTCIYVVFLTYRQNLFLSVAGIFMEMNLLPIEIARIMRKAGVPRDSAAYRNVAILSCTLTMVSRGVLPILFLSIAITHQSPFSMSYAPLTMFFLCVVFMFVINFWMIFQTVSRLVRQSPCTRQDNADFAQSNNVLSNCSRVTLVDPESGSVHDVKLSKLNYGLLRSYDNRNIYSSVSSSDKMNITHKKDVSKDLIPCRGSRGTGMGSSRCCDSPSETTGQSVCQYYQIPDSTLSDEDSGQFGVMDVLLQSSSDHLGDNNSNSSSTCVLLITPNSPSGSAQTQSGSGPTRERQQVASQLNIPALRSGFKDSDDDIAFEGLSPPSPTGVLNFPDFDTSVTNTTSCYEHCHQEVTERSYTDCPQDTPHSSCHITPPPETSDFSYLSLSQINA